MQSLSLKKKNLLAVFSILLPETCVFCAFFYYQSCIVDVSEDLSSSDCRKVCSVSIVLFYVTYNLIFSAQIWATSTPIQCSSDLQSMIFSLQCNWIMAQ